MTSPSRTELWDAFSTRLFDQNKFAIKLGLDNMRAALEAEGLPDTNSRRLNRTIIVAGTNGKGSTASTLAAILQADDYSVGLYTSPHLIEVRERFRINGKPLSRKKTLEIGDYVLEKYADPDGEICLTFFELTTLMAAIAFDRMVDYSIYEIGLGGRLDAVNALEPDLSIITNIGFDHQAYLGDTIASIAHEKYGIIRPDVPVIIGPQRYELPAISHDNITFVEPQPTVHDANQQTAIAAARKLLGKKRKYPGLRNARWPGRGEVRTLKNGDVSIEVVLDAAHNTDAITQVLPGLLAEHQPDLVVFGGMRDKSFDGLSDLIDGIPRFGIEVESPRAMDSVALRALLGEKTETGGVDVILPRCVGKKTLVVGSVYLVGEVLAWGGITADDLVTYVE